VLNGGAQSAGYRDDSPAAGPTRTVSHAPVAFAPGTAVFILLLLLLLTISRVAVVIVLVLLAVWSLLGPARAVQSMALAVIVKYSNPGLVDLGPESGPLLWLVLLTAGLRVLPTLNAADARKLVVVLGFTSLAALLSVFTSHHITVSLLKAATFAWVISTLVVAVRALSAVELARLATWFATLSTLVICLSALTLLAPSVARLLNGTGLQGIFIHPQTLAIVAAPVAAVSLTTVALRKRGVGSLVLLGFTTLAWTVLVLTEARTGVFAATVGVAAGFTMHLWQRRRDPALVSRARLVAVTVAALLAVGTYAVVSGRLSESVDSFLLKRSGENSLGDAFYASRGAGIVSQWRNFLEQPIAGHGFGVYAGDEFQTEVVEFAGIPISAPVEKGFLPTAVLEETGILGGLVFIALMLQLVRLAWRSGDARWFALFCASVATNVGEASMLSPGAPGLLLWCFIVLAIEIGRVTGRPGRAERPAAAVASPGMAAASPVVDFPNLMR
jgi:hypothetical protein